MGISVIVCCFNSEWIIEQTLEALINQEVSDNLNWEIIVIDNNSNDNTSEAVNTFINNNRNVTIRIVSEPRQGLSHARLKGYEASNYSYLLYCDDDNFLGENYIQSAFDIMESNPDISLLGGVGHPIYESEPEPRILPFIAQYAIGPQGNCNLEDITISRGYVYGAGMILRKRCFADILSKGFKFFNIGRNGKLLTGAEDVELGNAMRIAGFRIFFSNRLIFKHYLKSNRLSWDYLKRMNFGSGVSSSLMMPLNFIKFSLLFGFMIPIYSLLYFIKEFYKLKIYQIFNKEDSNLLKIEIARGGIIGTLQNFKSIATNFKILKKSFTYI